MRFLDRNIIVYCKNCGEDSKIIKCGKRKTIFRGEIQRYRCKSCNYKFSIDSNRQRMPEEVICHALYLRNNGKSIREIAKQIVDKFGYTISHMSIFNWIIKFEEHNPKNYDKIFLWQLLRLKVFLNKYCIDKIKSSDLREILMIGNKSYLMRSRFYTFGILEKDYSIDEDMLDKLIKIYKKGYEEILE